MNQVNEQSWKNPDENNNSVSYNFDCNKIEIDDHFIPSKIKYSDSTVIKEQFYRPSSQIRKPTHRKKHFKISKDDFELMEKETDERSLTLFSLDTLHCWWKKSLRQIHYYVSVQLLEINAIKKAVDKLQQEKRPILSYGYDFWKTAMHYYVEQNSSKYGTPDMHIILDSYVLMKTCFKCAETRPDFKKTLDYEPVFRDDRLINEFKELMKKKPNLAQAYCEFFAVLYDFEFLKSTLFLCHDDEFVNFGEEVEISILKKFILWRHDAEQMEIKSENDSREERLMDTISEDFGNFSVAGSTVKSVRSTSRNSIKSGVRSSASKHSLGSYKSSDKFSGKVQASKAPACLNSSYAISNSCQSRSSLKGGSGGSQVSLSIFKSEEKFRQTLKLWDEKLKFEVLREQFVKFYPKNLYTEISSRNSTNHGY